MANCVVTIEIKEYHPENLNFSNFSFIFRSEINKFEDEISFSNKNSLLHRASTKKEIKYSIKITKSKSLIGITDFVIPQAVLLKKEETYSKLCQVTMTESIRRMILGNNWLSDSLKILIHATFQYIKKPSSLKQSHSLPGTEENELAKKNQLMPNIQKIKSDLYERVNQGTTTPPINTSKMFTYKKPLSTKKSTSQKRSIRSIGKVINHNDNYNTNMNSHRNNQSDIKSSSPNKDIIDQEFQNLNPFQIKQLNDIHTVEAFHSLSSKYLNEISKIATIMNIKDDSNILNKTKEIITKILIIQTEYHQGINKDLKENNLLRTQIGYYNEQFNHIAKQRYKIIKTNEALDFKQSIANDLKINRCQFTKESIPIVNNEIKLYQIIFDKLSNKNNIAEMKKIEKQNKEESLLLSILKTILQSKNTLIKDIPQSLQGSLSYLITKYSLQYLINSDDLLKIKTNKNNSNHINEVNEQGINIDSEEEEKNLEECDTVHVISDTIDETDIKLDRYLNYFYSKRKIVKIPLKKTSPFNYEYGSQKIMIKSEGETFRVKHIGKYIILDKFIEINAPLEEEKMKNLQKGKNKNPLTKRSQGGSGSKSQRSHK